MTQYLGVLVSANRYGRLLAGEGDPWLQALAGQQERFGAALQVLALPTVDVESDRAVTAMYDGRAWRESETAGLPRVIYNLLAHPGAAESRVLRDLNGRRDTVVFNETNRFDRGMLIGMLASVPVLREVLPPTVEATPALAGALEPGLILLVPGRRPLRAGLLLDAQPRRVHYRDLPGRRSGLMRGTLSHVVPYLATGDLRWLSRLPGYPVGPEGPVEYRLYLHRDEAGGWTAAGGVAKSDVLRPQRRKERCWSLPEALAITFGRREAASLQRRLEQLALWVAEGLALYQPGLVHCAVDFWVDGEGRPFFADLAGRYRTDWLEKAGEQEAVARLIAHPFRFARTLAQTGVEKLYVDFGRTGGDRRV